MGKTLRILLGGDFLIALIAAQVHLLSLVGTRTAAAERLAGDFAKGLPLVGVLLLTGYLAELYSRDRQFTPRQAGVRITVSVVLAFALLSGLYALSPAIHIDQHLLALSLACYGVGQFLW
ncbi:MAG: hypothetical protein IH614_16270, partial [Desulfuromonadales bacterium]|nr:hypothetical protein [Desulfuromonadales bacterium]